MNQAEVTKLMSQLKFAIRPKHRRMKNPKGPEGRLMKLRQSVTALLKYERLEMNYNRADETRGYAERLISDAIRNGDKHKPTMEMADFWLLDKSLVHKLFKVLCPRFENHTTAVTRLFKAPRDYPVVDANKRYRAQAILELKGNPYPHVKPDMNFANKNFIHNVLFNAAKKDFHYHKFSIKPGSEEVTTKEKVETIKEQEK